MITSRPKAKRVSWRTVEVGDRFLTNGGSYCKVLEYRNCDEVLVEFEDENKFRLVTGTRSLKKGKVKNPWDITTYGKGYLGIGKYKAKDEGGITKCYSTWRSMLRRCYDSKYKKGMECYDGVYVCEEWLDFQVFADWYFNHNFYDVGYDLDKDLLVRGNKIYSPETCCMLPSNVNSGLALPKSVSRELPMGVTISPKGRYNSRICTKEGGRHIGVYDTPEEASAAYVKAKEDYIHSLAEKWHGKIEERAYQALKSWTVYP